MRGTVPGTFPSLSGLPDTYILKVRTSHITSHLTGHQSEGGQRGVAIAGSMSTTATHNQNNTRLQSLIRPYVWLSTVQKTRVIRRRIQYRTRTPWISNTISAVLSMSPESSIKYSIHKKTLRERCCYPSIPIPPTHLPYPFPHNGASLPPTPTDKHVQYKQLRRPASQPGIPFVRPCACKNKPPGFLPLSALRHPA